MMRDSYLSSDHRLVSSNNIATCIICVSDCLPQNLKKGQIFFVHFLTFVPLFLLFLVFSQPEAFLGLSLLSSQTRAPSLSSSCLAQPTASFRLLSPENPCLASLAPLSLLIKPINFKSGEDDLSLMTMKWSQFKSMEGIYFLIVAKWLIGYLNNKIRKKVSVDAPTPIARRRGPLLKCTDPLNSSSKACWLQKSICSNLQARSSKIKLDLTTLHRDVEVGLRKPVEGFPLEEAEGGRARCSGKRQWMCVRCYSVKAEKVKREIRREVGRMF